MRVEQCDLLVLYSRAMMASDQVLARDLGCRLVTESSLARALPAWPDFSRQPQRLPRTTDTRLGQDTL